MINDKTRRHAYFGVSQGLFLRKFKGGDMRVIRGVLFSAIAALSLLVSGCNQSQETIKIGPRGKCGTTGREQGGRGFQKSGQK